MAGFTGSGLGKIRGFADVWVITGLAMLLAGDMANAEIVPVPPDLNDELYVQENFNVTGARAPYRDSNGNLIYNNGQLARQENEPSCGINPLNPLNRMCAFNWYGFSDRPEHGDAWIGFSESMDGRTFKRRPLTGYNAHKNPIGKEFAADPTMLVFPGGAMVTFIAGDRAGNSVMVVQRMMEVNREYGFRHVSEERLITIESLGGVHFIDKPDAQILIDPNGGFSEVTMTLEEPVDDDNDPSTPAVTEVVRVWPNFRIVVSFADFGGSGENIRTWSTYSDDFGVTWSNKRQISNTSGLDQGLSIEDKGDDLLYVFRRFDSGENRASIMGALSRDRGERIGKVFEITDICDFDMITSPSDENPNRASVRSNAFPWLSATDTHFVLAYVERPRDGADGLIGNCLNSYVDNPPGDTDLFDGVAGTRVVVRTSTDGKNWSAPEPVMPFNTNRKPWVDVPDPNAAFPPVHFNFMPTLDCARGSCNVIYYSTLTESQTYEKLAEDPARPWEKTGFVEDFSAGNSKYYRRFLDIFSSKIRILHGNGNGPGTPILSPYPERVSKYQLDFDDDGNPDTPCLDATKCKPFEKEWNPANILNYGGNSKPFIGDYIALAAEEWRKENGLWVDNASPVGGLQNIGAAINQPSYFAAWTDNRRVRVFYNDDGSPLPYAVPDGTLFVEHDVDETGEDFSERPQEQAVAERSGTKEPWVRATERTKAETRPDRFLSAYAYMARGEEDDNDPAKVGLCQPQATPNTTVQTRVKDAEIYGALIEDWSSLGNRVRLVSPAAAKNYLNSDGQVIQRGFVIGAQNIDPDEPRPLALVIKNQPSSGRASWRQLPIDADSTEPPELDEFILAERLSTEYVTLFVISKTDEPVTVSVYDYFPPATEGGTGTIGTTVLDEITVSARSEAGDLWDPGTLQGLSVLDNEIHNPFLIEPDWANLEVNELNPNFKNPNFKNPNFKNPNFKNTDYMDPNFKNPNFKNPNFKNTTVESTNLQNPNFKNPNFKNTALVDGFVDVTYQVVSLNNTTTATNADFAYGGEELDDLDIEVIAWQADELDSLQDCDPEFDPDLDPAVITESKVVAAKSLAPNFKNPNFKNPNFKNLAPADITDPFQGFVSFPLPPAGTINTTVRVFCVRDLSFDPDVDPFSDPPVRPAPGSCEDLIFQTPNPDYDLSHSSCSGEDPDPQFCEPKLNDGKLQNKLGYNFWAQKANTGETQITNGREQLIKDVVPPAFTNVPSLGPVQATSPAGAVVTYTEPTANDSSGIATPPGVVCTPASGSAFPIGTTPVTCNATDLADPPNTGTATFTVNVVDTTPPEITLLGDNPQVIEGGDPYTELGAKAADIVDGDLSGSIVIDASAVNTSVPGSYDVTYDVSDTRGNNAVTAIRTVNVVDTTPPEITLLGDNPQVIEGGDPYTELGAKAADIVDGDLSGSIVIDANAVNTSVPGSYDVTYDVSDTEGNNAATVTRTISVVDNTPPIITLLGDNPQVIEGGDPYTELGATAADIVDGNLSVSIVIDASAVNTSVPGNYGVTYDVSDTLGNATRVTRTVSVVDTAAPVITLLGDNPQVIEGGESYVELGASAFDIVFGDLSGSIVIDASAVNTSVPGNYGVTYDVSDTLGNATRVTRTVSVVDTAAPVITLLGDNPQVIEGGDPYTELGATAADIVDGDLSVSIVIDASAVNTSVPGSYDVTYDVSDTRGNNAVTAIRTVSVVDTTPPEITLRGGNPLVIVIGTAYVDPGAEATDIVDGDLSGSIVIDSSDVNPATFGNYTVTYNVSDAEGNAAAEVTRTVRVEFNGTAGVSFGKNNIKAGSVLPFSWSWKDSAGNNRAVEPNTHRLTVRVISCSDPGCIPGSVVFLNPGNSGIQLLADLSYQSNWQTINEITGEDLWPGDYRATVELVSPAGKALQTQISDLINIRASSGN